MAKVRRSLVIGFVVSMATGSAFAQVAPPGYGGMGGYGGYGGYGGFGGYGGYGGYGGLGNGGYGPYNPSAASIIAGQPTQQPGATVMKDSTGQPLAGGVGTPAPAVDPAVYMRGQTPTREDVRNPNSAFYSSYGETGGVSGVRMKVIQRAGRGVGIRAGFAAEARVINDAVEARFSEVLDAKYPFASVMIDGKVVPPVIVEMDRVAERGGDRLIYLTLEGVMYFGD